MTAAENDLLVSKDSSNVSNSKAIEILQLEDAQNSSKMFEKDV